MPSKNVKFCRKPILSAFNFSWYYPRMVSNPFFVKAIKCVSSLHIIVPVLKLEKKILHLINTTLFKYLLYLVINEISPNASPAKKVLIKFMLPNTFFKCPYSKASEFSSVSLFWVTPTSIIGLIAIWRVAMKLRFSFTLPHAFICDTFLSLYWVSFVIVLTWLPCLPTLAYLVEYLLKNLNKSILPFYFFLSIIWLSELRNKQEYRA